MPKAHNQPPKEARGQDQAGRHPRDPGSQWPGPIWALCHGHRYPIHVLQGLSENSRSDVRYARLAGLRGDHTQLARKDNRDGRGRRNRCAVAQDHVESEAIVRHVHGELSCFSVGGPELIVRTCTTDTGRTPTNLSSPDSTSDSSCR